MVELVGNRPLLAMAKILRGPWIFRFVPGNEMLQIDIFYDATMAKGFPWCMSIVSQGIDGKDKHVAYEEYYTELENLLASEPYNIAKFSLVKIEEEKVEDEEGN